MGNWGTALEPRDPRLRLGHRLPVPKRGHNPRAKVPLDSLPAGFQICYQTKFVSLNAQQTEV